MKDKKDKILIVEDEVDLRRLLKSKLSGEGFDVLEAENGKAGLWTVVFVSPSRKDARIFNYAVADGGPAVLVLPL